MTGRRRIRFAYDREKAGQLAAQFVELAGGSLPLLKLLKLMYLVDRESLVDTGFPVTGDSIVAMDNGPVLSKTYDHLKPNGKLPHVVSKPSGVKLEDKSPPRGRLSDYEVDLAHRAFKRFGHMSGQQLIGLLHKAAPEWEPPPKGSSSPIDPASILRAEKKTEAEITAIAEQADYFLSVNRHLG
jgi:uncharacterized phage-associated protein